MEAAARREVDALSGVGWQRRVGADGLQRGVDGQAGLRLRLRVGLGVGVGKARDAGEGG